MFCFWSNAPVCRRVVRCVRAAHGELPQHEKVNNDEFSVCPCILRSLVYPAKSLESKGPHLQYCEQSSLTDRGIDHMMLHIKSFLSDRNKCRTITLVNWFYSLSSILCLCVCVFFVGVFFFGFLQCALLAADMSGINDLYFHKQTCSVLSAVKHKEGCCLLFIQFIVEPQHRSVMNVHFAAN